MKQINNFEDLQMLRDTQTRSSSMSMQNTSLDSDYSAEITSHLSDYDIYVVP